MPIPEFTLDPESNAGFTINLIHQAVDAADGTEVSYHELVADGEGVSVLRLSEATRATDDFLPDVEYLVVDVARPGNGKVVVTINPVTKSGLNKALGAFGIAYDAESDTFVWAER